MITAVPRHWFSWGFAVTEEGKSLAGIDMSMWREKGELTISNEPYRAYREALFSGAYILESRDAVIARARKPSAFSRRMVIECDGAQYELKPRSPLSRRFHLLSGTTVVGTLSPAGLMSRRMNVDLPDKLALPLKTFVVWLTLIMWKRDSESGG